VQPFAEVDFLTRQLVHRPHEDIRALVYHGLECANRTERVDLQHVGFQVFVEGCISRRKDSVEDLCFVPSAKGSIEITLSEKSECRISKSQTISSNLPWESSK
jgi:hypothetical protein